MRSIDFALDFMKKVDMPEEAISFYEDVFGLVLAEKELMFTLFALERRYMCVTRRFVSLKAPLMSLARKLKLPQETVDFMFLLFCLRTLHERYIQKGYSEELFYDTMSDLKYKLIECRDVKGIWGTFVASWNDGFYRMERFALGRFQYEVTRWAWTKYEKHGIKIKNRRKVVNFHIPSSKEPITYDVRVDSYKKAKEFYKDMFGDKPALFVCTSWLLYEPHREFLPEKSNILDFMDDFDIIKSIPVPGFHDGWRVFADKAKLPPEQLPEDTSLQRAFKQRLVEKKSLGYGYGLVIFDGEKILTRNK